MKPQIDDSTPFSASAHELVKEWAERRFFGIKTDKEAVERLEQELKKMGNQLKDCEKKLKSIQLAVIKGGIHFEMASGLRGKLEESLLDLAALALQSATITDKWINR